MFGRKSNKVDSKSKAIEITDENFDEIVRDSSVPVLLDFYADWCGPCKILGPFIDEIAGDYKDKAIIGKVNVDRQSMLTEKFQIRSMPTLLFIKDNIIVDGHSGLLPKPNIAEILDGLIDK